jgi:AcrR family transcriptional regulator
MPRPANPAISHATAGTTVAQIANQAGLTKTTFFRHFSDKREVLFAAQETHSRLIADGTAAAPDSATPLEAVAAALDAITASFTAQQRELGPLLLAVIADNPELQERATFKRAALAAALTSALGKRGVPDLTARLAADLAARALDRAYERWIEPSSQQEFTELAREELQALLTAAMKLG